MDYIKLNSFCTSLETVYKMKKDNLQNGRKYLQIIYLIRGFYPKYIKNIYNSIAKKPKCLIKKLGRGGE